MESGKVIDKFELLRQSAEITIRDMEETEKRRAEMETSLEQLSSLLRMAADEIIVLLPHKQGCCLVEKMLGQKTDGDKCDCGARNTPFFNAMRQAEKL